MQEEEAGPLVVVGRGAAAPFGGPPLARLMACLLFVVGAVPLAALLLLVARLLVLPLLLPVRLFALPLSFAFRGGPFLLVGRALPVVQFAAVLPPLCR